MPTLSPTWDGYVGAGTSAWASLMTATSGKSFVYSQESQASAIKVSANSNNTAHQKYDVFLEFPSIGASVESATFKFYAENVEASTGTMGIRGLKGSWTNNTDNNFNDFDPFTEYFTRIEAVGEGWNTGSLNAGALSQLETGALKIYLVEEFVYTSVGNFNAQPDAGYGKNCDFYFSESDDKAPYIDYTLSNGSIIHKEGLIQINSGRIVL